MSAALLPHVEVIMWNLGNGSPPSVSHVRQSLEANGLDVSRLSDIANSTAFRRAAVELRSDDVSTTLFTKKHVVGSVEFDTVAVQVDRSRHYSESSQRLESDKAGVYLLDDRSEDEEVHILPCTWDSCPLILSELRSSYVSFRHNCQWGDLSTVLNAILKKDGMGTYSPRKAGGVYFCPLNQTLPDLMDRVEQFSIETGVSLVRLGVPDTGAARRMVRDSIADAMLVELRDHKSAIENYSEDTRSNTFVDRRASMAGTLSAVYRMESLLGDSVAPLRGMIIETLGLLDAKEQLAANRVAPRRRQLVTS